MAGDVLYLVVGEVYYSGGKEIISRNLIFASKNHPEVFLNIFAGLWNIAWLVQLFCLFLWV